MNKVLNKTYQMAQNWGQKEEIVQFHLGPVTEFWIQLNQEGLDQKDGSYGAKKKGKNSSRIASRITNEHCLQADQPDLRFW
jgi:hypothetical protein